MIPYFAKSLAAGTIEVPARTSWWPRHARGIQKYLLLSQGKTPNGRQAVLDTLRLEAKEWENMVPKSAKHGVMDDHVELEIELVDAVRNNDSKHLEEVAKQLLSNTTQMTAALGIAIHEFPEKSFKHLLINHVSLYATAVRKDIEGVVTNKKETEANTLQLAALTAEWF